jgi:ribonuclease HII
VAGVDEAGRGAWAGPVVAAAVILPSDVADELDLVARFDDQVPVHFAGIRDSKQLSPLQRAAADCLIRHVAVGVGLGVVPAEVVDTMGIAAAGQLAFWRAVCGLPTPPDFLLVDGFPLWSHAFPQTAVLQGDARCLSIAAASIVAKVHRDGLMRTLAKAYPEFGFAQNVGYGTRAHLAALQSYGPSPWHRRSYAPVALVCSTSSAAIQEPEDDDA